MPVREGVPGERTTAGILFPPQNQDRLSTLLLPLGSLPKAEPNQTAAQTEPTFLLTSGVFGIPLEGASKNQKCLASSPGVVLPVSNIFCPGPLNWTAARLQNLALSRAGKEVRQESRELGLLLGSPSENRLPTWLITRSVLEPGNQTEEREEEWNAWCFRLEGDYLGKISEDGKIKRWVWPESVPHQPLRFTGPDPPGPLLIY